MARSNRGFTQAESLITVKQLKERYLFGLLDVTDSEGNSISDETLQVYINNAVSMLEHYLDIAIMPRTDVEEKDYYANDYWDWGYFQLNHFPLLSIDKMEISYLKDNDGNDISIQEIPKAWIHTNKDTGIVRLIPNNKFPANLQVGSGGNFFPELFRRHSHVPQLWHITYTHGFAEGCIPVLFNAAIGLTAAMYALSVAGNLVLGAGIAGSSLSLDGLSQSIQTTPSAENSAYSATLKEYQARMFGATKDDPNSIIRILKDFYKGQGINII